MSCSPAEDVLEFGKCRGMTMVEDEDMTYIRYLAMWRSDLDGNRPREWKHVHDEFKMRARAMLKGRCMLCRHGPGLEEPVRRMLPRSVLAHDDTF